MVVLRSEVLVPHSDVRSEVLVLHGELEVV